MSDPAEQVYRLLKAALPYYKLFLEYYVVYAGQKLFFDFYLPELGVAIEVQGEQHYRFVGHFHGTASSYKKHKYRDSLKAEWALLNDIRLVEVRYDALPKTEKELMQILFVEIPCEKK